MSAAIDQFVLLSKSSHRKEGNVAVEAVPLLLL